MNAEALRFASEKCWDSILRRDIKMFGQHFRESFEAQIKMFPNMIFDDIPNIINKYRNLAYGWKLSGAGGGGYLIYISEKPMKGAMQIKIRRKAL
jgi:galactokinase/mevalonate kinase-like predicted kinase